MSLIFNPRMKPRLGTPINKAIAHKLGLVGCWLFNEDGGGQVFDLSGNGNTGTMHSTVSWVSGRFGCCIYHVNNDSCQTSFGDLGTFTKLTISFWAAPGSHPAERMRYIDDEKGFTCFTDAEGGSMKFFVGNGSSWSNSITTDAVFNADIWHHFVITCDGSFFKAYIDGILQSDTEAYTSTVKLNSFIISGSSNNYVGKFDNLGIFNRALGAGEIQQLYREPFCMFQRELIELWAASGGAPPAGHPYYYREFANRRIA